jgi:hypothetical protein
MVSSWKTKIACGIKYCYVKKINVKSAALYVLFCTLLPAFQELGLELPLELLFDVMNKKKKKITFNTTVVCWKKQKLLF